MDQRVPPIWFEQAKQLYSNGFSLRHIASTVNVAPATVQRWFKILNVTTRRSGGRCTFDSEEAVRLWKQGQTIDQIAAVVGVNRTAVYEQLKRRGVNTSARWHKSKVVITEPHRTKNRFKLPEYGIQIDSNLPLANSCQTDPKFQILNHIKAVYSGPVTENDRTIISPHELDIVLPELKVAIEVCGMYWHSEKFKDRFYHQRKMESANKAGYRLITLYEEEITDTDLAPITWRKLSHILGVTSTQPVNARGCTIVELSSADAEGFLKHNHIQWYMKASVRYGLKHGAELVAVVTFKSYAGGVYELSRFATSTRVRGGFTKLLHHFKKNNVWTSIYTFADLRWSSRTNNVYVLAGFTEEHVTQPAYRYYCGRTKKSYHRMHFQRKHLPQRLRKFDPSLTERQNVNNDGYLAIYDCGNVKYKMTNPINPS